MRQVFPGVAERFDRSAKWYESQGIRPLFGVYWNLCINAEFPGQARIHCGPHADRKNIVGICTLLVYERPGGESCLKWKGVCCRLIWVAQQISTTQQGPGLPSGRLVW